jgi:hypothetical protein
LRAALLIFGTIFGTFASALIRATARDRDATQKYRARWLDMGPSQEIPFEIALPDSTSKYRLKPLSALFRRWVSCAANSANLGVAFRIVQDFALVDADQGRAARS